MSNYAAKKELEHAAVVEKSDLATKTDFIAFETEVDQLDINKLVNVPTSLNRLKTNVDDLDVGICSYRFENVYVVDKKLQKTACNKFNLEI